MYKSTVTNCINIIAIHVSQTLKPKKIHALESELNYTWAMAHAINSMCQ